MCKIIFKTLKKEEDWKKYLEVALASHKKLPHLKPTRALDKAGRKLTAQLTTAGRKATHLAEARFVLF